MCKVEDDDAKASDGVCAQQDQHADGIIAQASLAKRAW